jgi:hypothetical protein
VRQTCSSLGSNLLAPSALLIVQSVVQDPALLDDCESVADAFKQLGSALGQALDTLTIAATILNKVPFVSAPVVNALRSAECGVDFLAKSLNERAHRGLDCQYDIQDVLFTLKGEFETAIRSYTSILGNLETESLKTGREFE